MDRSSTGRIHLFGCCHLWHVCQYGKNPCPIKDKEHDRVQGCACYRRFVRNQASQEVPDQVPDFMGFDEEGQGYLL